MFVYNYNAAKAYRSLSITKDMLDKERQEKLSLLKENLIKEKYQVYDRKAKTFRDIRPKDIVILLRSTKNKASIYEQELVKKYSKERKLLENRSLQCMNWKSVILRTKKLPAIPLLIKAFIFLIF